MVRISCSSLNKAVVFAAGMVLAVASSVSYGAAVSVDLNAFYFSDTFAYETNSSYKRTFYDGSLNLALTRRGDVTLGWSYGRYSLSDTVNDETSELSITEMGPKVGWFFNRSLTWGVFFTYGLVVKGDYSPGGGAESVEFRGTSMKAELAYLPMIGAQTHLGVKIVYAKFSFKEEVSGGTELEGVGHGRTLIYPSLSFIYRF